MNNRRFRTDADMMNLNRRRKSALLVLLLLYWNAITMVSCKMESERKAEINDSSELGNVDASNWVKYLSVEQFRQLNYNTLTFPVVIQDSFVKKWSQAFSVSSLQGDAHSNDAQNSAMDAYVFNKTKMFQQISAVTDVDQAFEPIYVYTESDRLIGRWKAATLQRDQHERSDYSVRLENITFEQMSKLVASEETSFQWNGILPAHLREQFPSLDLFHLVNTGEDADAAAAVDKSEKEEEIFVNLWMNKVNLTSGIHYDPSHNLFAQIVGCKRFLIADDKSLGRVKLHPFFHPKDRQSQLETMFKKPAPKAFSRMDIEQRLLADHGFHRLDLSPGDLLFLPSYFLHRVTAVECEGVSEEAGGCADIPETLPEADRSFMNKISVSVNAFLASSGKHLSDQVQSMDNLPRVFHPDESGSSEGISPGATTQRVSGVVKIHYLIELLHSVAAHVLFQQDRRAGTEAWDATISATKDFVASRILQERYLFDVDVAELLSCQGFDASMCPESVFSVANVEQTLFQMSGEDGQIHQDFLNDLDELIELFARSEATQKVKEIIMADFIERVVTLVVSVEKVCKFLQCFSNAS